jgi:UDP-N-acetyl-2-amino-2-deoxyglucuronate dehydrogenase
MQGVLTRMINFAIVGMGHIANKHIESINKIEDANLYAICDTDQKRLDQVKDQAKTFTDLEKMLTDCPEIDVVNICVPSGLHARLTEIAAKHGKHIIVEKPMALKIEDAEKMIETAKRNQIKLAVVHPNRFRPAIQQLKTDVEAGRFGILSHANATVRWNRNQEYYDQAAWRGTKEFDGGVLMNQAIHNLDLLLWLMGPVESVQAMAATRLRKIETEDVAAAVVRFKNGAIGVIEAATTVYPKNLEESLAIFGEKASVKIGGRTANWIETMDIEGMSDLEKDVIISQVKEEPYGRPGHECIIADMVVAIKEDREPIVNGEDGLAPMKLILAILESAEKGIEIKIS